MTDTMDEGEGVPMHTPIHSPAHSPIHSPTLQRAANVPTAELLRALMATVADLTLSVAQTKVQQALGFGAASILSSAPGTNSSEVVVAFPRELPATENRMGRSPMLYVQLQIGTNILPALVDSGA